MEARSQAGRTGPRCGPSREGLAWWPPLGPVSPLAGPCSSTALTPPVAGQPSPLLCAALGETHGCFKHPTAQELLRGVFIESPRNPVIHTSASRGSRDQSTEFSLRLTRSSQPPAVLRPWGPRTAPLLA